MLIYSSSARSALRIVRRSPIPFEQIVLLRPSMSTVPRHFSTNTNATADERKGYLHGPMRSNAMEKIMEVRYFDVFVLVLVLVLVPVAHVDAYSSVSLFLCFSSVILFVCSAMFVDDEAG